MSEQERLNIREKLNQALEESYEKMLCLKAKLGDTVVTTDSQGAPQMIAAEELWAKYKADKID